MTLLAVIGAKALYLTFVWLGSAIVGSWLSDRKGYGEKPGLAAGLLLSAVGVLIWLVWPARDDSRWKVQGPLGRGEKTVAEARAERGGRQPRAEGPLGRHDGLGRFEKVGAWLGVWTPPRDAEVPPPPWRKIALGALVRARDRGRRRGARRARASSAARRSARRPSGAGTPPSRRPSASGWPRRASRAAVAASGPPGGSPAPQSCARAGRSWATWSAPSPATRGRGCALGTLDGPVLATECEINPPSQRRVERDLSARGSDYECLAVTSRDPEGRFVVGHIFDATVDYRRFRFTVGQGVPAAGRGSRAARVLTGCVV